MFCFYWMLIFYFQDCSLYACPLTSPFEHSTCVFLNNFIGGKLRLIQPLSPPYPIHHIYRVTNFDPEYRDITFSFSFCFGLENKTLYNVDSYAFPLLWNTRFQWFTCVILTPFASHKGMEIDTISSTVLCLYTRFHHHLSLLSYEINFMPTEERDMKKKFISRIIFH